MNEIERMAAVGKAAQWCIEQGLIEETSDAVIMTPRGFWIFTVLRGTLDAEGYVADMHRAADSMGVEGVPDLDL